MFVSKSSRRVRASFIYEDSDRHSGRATDRNEHRLTIGVVRHEAVQVGKCAGVYLSR